MLFDLLSLILSAFGAYFICARLWKRIFSGNDPIPPISEGVHVRLGFCESEIEEALEMLDGRVSRYADAPPVLLVDCLLRDEVLAELALSADLYLSYEEYYREKRRTVPPRGEDHTFGECRERDLSE